MGTVIDIALIAIVAIAFIVGLFKGFIKQFTGLLGGLVSSLGAVVLVMLLMPMVVQLDLFVSFAGTAAGWFDGEVFVATFSSPQELADALANNGGFWSILSGLSDRIYEMMVSNGCTTLGQFAGLFVADLICDFVLWLIIFIILKLLFGLLRSLLLKLTALPILKSLDRIFGAIWSVMLTYVIIVGVLLTGVELITVRFLPDSLGNIMNIIAQSKVLTIAHNTNIVGSMLAGLLGMQLPALAVPV